MQQRLTLITLGINNLEKMRSFYQNTFGWKPLENSSDQIVFFQLNGILLSLYGREALAEDAEVSSVGSGFKGFTLAHNLRSEEEVDQLFSELESKGAKIVKHPRKVFWGGYSGYIADPEDNLWEIAYNPFMEYDEAGNVV
ncbi:MAG: VOC family protein [candidate division Zixibacteria bacterium]|nr:VOC family protein [Gammaproteobacteria bacterium]NIX58134.1 VOC family protein [candidate division Zixibacteria bacterium]